MITSTDDAVPQAVSPETASPPTITEVFHEFLTPSQRSSVSNFGYFFVQGQSGTWYRILVGSGLAGNVRRLRYGTVPGTATYLAYYEEQLCAHIAGGYNSYISQMMHLRHAEKLFLGIANVYSISFIGENVWPWEAIREARGK